jgi:protein gp37
VIVGSESGPGARSLREEGVISIQQQCSAARVTSFFKRWGRVQKSKAGRELNETLETTTPGATTGRFENCSADL